MKKIPKILMVFYAIRLGVLAWAWYSYGWQLAVILFLTIVTNELIGKR